MASHAGPRPQGFWPKRNQGPGATEPDFDTACVGAATQSASPLSSDLDAHPDFEAIYREHFSAVYGFCLRRLKSPDRAADATSIVFTKIFLTLPTYKPHPNASFRAWVFRIARNVVIDITRQDARLAPLNETVTRALPDPQLGPEELVVGADQRRQLLDAMNALPSAQRQVVELRLAGLTGAEIAACLDRRIGAVKMLQFRAFRALRESLSSLDETRGNDHDDQR